MAGLKEIRRRLKSVTNTKKITYAMKLVSAAKLRKAQDAVMRSREYTDALQRLLRDLLAEQAGRELAHPLLQPHPEVKKIKLLIVGGSRGLCGGYNTNLHKRVEVFFRETTSSKPGVAIGTIIMGRKPADHYRRIKRDFVQAYEKLSEDANYWPIDEVCAQLEAEYQAGEIDEAYVIYTKFRSALSMSVQCEKLLPLDPSALVDPNARASSEPAGSRGVTLFEPSPEAVFDAVIPRIMRSRVRQACLDAKASEHGSRMAAMDSATKNASDLASELKLTRNRLRQSEITSQLLDIIGGSEAIS